MRIDRYAVLGRPIAHSLSPVMQGAAFAAAGLPSSYEAIEVPPEALAEVVCHLREEGYRGFNVTVPHKGAVGAYLDALDSVAEATGAVNTVCLRDGRAVGYNTDVEGFRASIEVFSLTDGPAVVFGTGGAARAVMHVLRGMGRELVTVSRGGAPHLGYASPALLDVLRTASIVVNATPVGMAHLEDGSPLPAGTDLNSDALAVDLVYGRRTPFLRQAAGFGCRTVDGTEMLVQQGAAAFRLWAGIEPDIGAMRAAVGERVRCSVS